MHRLYYVCNYYVDIINRQHCQLFRQTNEFAKNILLTNIVFLKTSADVKISTTKKKQTNKQNKTKQKQTNKNKKTKTNKPKTMCQMSDKYCLN